jgi:hypothetical protein
MKNLVVKHKPRPDVSPDPPTPSVTVQSAIVLSSISEAELSLPMIK